MIEREVIRRKGKLLAKQRNYAAEYARRIQRGIARGLTRSQARGHPARNESLIRQTRKHTEWSRPLEEGVKRIRRGDTLTQAAKEIHVSAERLRSYLTGQGVGVKTKGRWTIGVDDRYRLVKLYSDGKELHVWIQGYDQARLVGEYMNDVKEFLKTQDVSMLEKYEFESVVDTSGVRHYFEIDPNNIYELESTSDDSFEDVYKVTM